jgi:hypothetical protein
MIIIRRKSEVGILVGISEMRWLGIVKNELRGLKVKTWRQRANNIGGCTSVAKKTKVLEGTQSQGVCKMV